VLQPVLSSAEKIQVDALKRSIEGDKKKAESTLDTAKKDYDRILKLHAQMLKSDQELELALKAHKHAEEELHAAKDKLTLFARPIERIAQVDPLKHTADLWYELDTAKIAGRLVKDQMVTVRVKVGKKEKASVVPYSAIIFDVHGNTYVYLEKTDAKEGKHLFE